MRAVVPCVRRVTGCQGICATAVVGSNEFRNVETGQVLVVCTTCHAPRFVSVEASASIGTTRLPPEIKKILRDSMREHRRRYRISVRGN